MSLWGIEYIYVGQPFYVTLETGNVGPAEQFCRFGTGQVLSGESTRECPIPGRVNGSCLTMVPDDIGNERTSPEKEILRG